MGERERERKDSRGWGGEKKKKSFFFPHRPSLFFSTAYALSFSSQADRKERIRLKKERKAALKKAKDDEHEVGD